MLIGINGGYFPAICRVCLIYSITVHNSNRNELEDVILVWVLAGAALPIDMKTHCEKINGNFFVEQ